MLISRVSQLLRRSSTHRWMGGDCMPLQPQRSWGGWSQGWARVETQHIGSPVPAPADTTGRLALHRSGPGTSPPQGTPHKAGVRARPRTISIMRWASSNHINVFKDENTLLKKMFLSIFKDIKQLRNIPSYKMSIPSFKIKMLVRKTLTELFQ